MTQKLRLATGLIIAAYVIPHLINHALGLISLDAMEAMRRVMSAVWGNAVGGVLLFGSLALHAVLALEAVYRRSHLRLPRWQLAQLGLGIAIPPLIMTHAIGTRATSELLGYDITYPYVLTAIWLGGPWSLVKQTALVLVVWLHLVVGLHFWLRLKPWYPKAVPTLYAMALLVPVLGLLGYFRATADVAQLATDPAWVERLFAQRMSAPPDLDGILKALEPMILGGMAAALLAILAARQVRRLMRNRAGAYRLQYPPDRTLTVPLGQTVLEALRVAGIPHASVCGGRGRCTTCRVRVGDGLDDLPPPEGVERDALARIHAEAEVRLACQIRPRCTPQAVITRSSPATA